MNSADLPKRIQIKVMFETERDYIHEEIKMIDAEIEPITQDLSSLKYKQTLGRYTDLSTEEGFITIAMIAMIVASIIAILAASIDLHPLLDIFPPIVQVFSVVLFSIGIILPVWRVYLHGRDIE